MRSSAGRFEVTCLLDARGAFTLGTPEETFPNATDQDWEQARKIDPAAFRSDGSWQLSFHCFVVRGPGDRVVLVDTGVGPAGSLASRWAPVPGRLPVALGEMGVMPHDVDLVVQTHLHADHVGWAVSAGGEPEFPHARYVVQSAELSFLTMSESALVPAVVEPLQASGQLDEVTGDRTLVGRHGSPGVSVIHTPGHTPGHQSVVVADGDDMLVITGDVLVHAVQLANPDVVYAHEVDQDEARLTRAALFSVVQGRAALLATAHFNEAFVAVPEVRGGKGNSDG